MSRVIEVLELRRDYERSGVLETVLGPLSFSIEAASVVGIVGENGAGKSTLLRALAGLVEPSAGAVIVNAPLGMVHQHFSLVPALSVAENVWLGEEPQRLGIFDRALAEARTREVAARLFGAIDAGARTESLSVAALQRVELTKAMRTEHPLLLLDEPTAVLVPAEIDALLKTIHALKTRGVTVLIVSHKLGEIAAICDRVLVLRRGALVLDASLPATPLSAIAEAMIGQTPEAVSAPPPVRENAHEVLRCEGFGEPLVLRAGEIRGIAGVAENGQEELFAALTGFGDVTLFGQRASGFATRRALGLRSVPADRRRDALLEDASLFDNLRLGNPGLSRQAALALLQAHDVRPAALDVTARALSGGNQQKLLFARELADTTRSAAAHSKCADRVFIVNEPSRGIDFHAQTSIWRALHAAAEDGAAVMAMSSDLDELRLHTQNVQILYRGKLAAPIDPRRTDNRTLGAQMAGLSGAAP